MTASPIDATPSARKEQVSKVRSTGPATDSRAEAIVPEYDMSPRPRRYDPRVRSLPLRIAVGVVGFAVAVYGVASLTGEWLGTPPWWEETDRFWVRPRPARKWVSGAVTALGLALVAFAAWPRRASRTHPPTVA